MLIGSGLRRSELAALDFENIQQRAARWLIATMFTSGRLNKHRVLRQGAEQILKLMASSIGCKRLIAVAPRIGRRNSNGERNLWSGNWSARWRRTSACESNWKKVQTSDSLRVGAGQVGPEALSMAAVRNKEWGLSHERTARVLELGYGLKGSRSGVCRALERLGNLVAPTYQQLPSALRQSPVVWLDDTGWRVGARPQNLRVLLSEQVTVYGIEPHRG